MQRALGVLMVVLRLLKVMMLFTLVTKLFKRPQTLQMHRPLKHWQVFLSVRARGGGFFRRRRLRLQVVFFILMISIVTSPPLLLGGLRDYSSFEHKASSLRISFIICHCLERDDSRVRVPLFPTILPPVVVTLFLLLPFVLFVAVV
ncbi:hypothetical protein V8F06_004303 [Rhypophila decipiens]